MKIGNIEVKQVAEGVITIQQEGEHESRCHVSKATDSEIKGESIKGDYLHLLAGTVAKMRNLNDKQILSIASQCGLSEKFEVMSEIFEYTKEEWETMITGFAGAIISATLNAGVDLG